MTAQQTGRGPSYIPAIDGLRAFAVGSVILFHLWPSALPGGFTGVDIFFVISGFVVTGSLLGRQFATLGALAAYFYARRLVRILPALIVMLLATILAAQLFIPTLWLGRNPILIGQFAFFGLSNIALAADADSYFGPLATYNPFTHTWSLGVEEQFYLVFPFLLHWHQRLHRGRAAIRVVAWLSVASLLLSAVLGQFAPRYALYLIFPRFWELGAGMLLCLTREQWQPLLAAMPAARRHGLALASAGILLAGFAIPETRLFPFPLALLPVTGTAGLIATLCAAPESAASRLLASRPLVAIGLLSYSLYLWHWPVFVLFRWTAGLHTLALQLAALVIAMALATASYFLVEQPLRTSRAIRNQPRGRVVLTALLAVAIAWLGGQTLIRAHNTITLSVTGDHDAWYADPGRALDPARSHCATDQQESGFQGGSLIVWTPRDCARPPAGFTLFVAGDSHGIAYTPALRQLAAELGVPIRLYFRAFCPFLPLIDTMASQPACQDYYGAMLRDIRASARPGDRIFLPGLRLARLTNQFEGATDHRSNRVAPEAMAEAERLLAQLAGTGARLVMEAPKPIFPSPAFRCADWFNRHNPICRGGTTIRRDTMLEQRRDVLSAMQQLSARQPALTLWDPFPTLCTSDPCDAMPGGRPRFFDGDHLSGAGNDLLYPGLRDALLPLRAPSPSGTAGSPARAGP
ncbi:acyltransferase family protein [Sphingomonas sp. dw_22]|uniref:acyltransferase family protein n=1 Tax=Sphingomonas sp. dw_22 TaxID=2721175 RepID=UPI001BD3AC0A|nr:acyltransferase family protein [Sphingomonas sp. dw_22]